MITHKLKRKYQFYKLRLKYEVSEMSKQLMVATILSGTLLVMAPMVSIAEPTTASVVAAEEVQRAETFWGKAKAVLDGSVVQGKSVWHAVTDADERLIRKDEQLNLAQKEIVELKRLLDQKTYVKGLSLVEAKSCVEVIQKFLTIQVEAK